MSFYSTVVLTTKQQISKLKETLFGKKPNPNFLSIMPKIDDYSSEYHVASSIILKLATGTISNLVQSTLILTHYVPAMMMALVIKEGFVLKMHKHMTVENIQQLEGIMTYLRALTKVTITNTQKFISEKLLGSLRYGTEIQLRDVETSSYVNELVLEYNANAKKDGKESAEIKLAERIILDATTKDAEGNYHTDIARIKKVSELITNYYFLLVSNKIVKSNLEGVTEESINSKNYNVVKENDSEAYLELISPVKDADALYSLHNSMFLKNINRLSSRKSLTMFNKNVTLDTEEKAIVFVQDLLKDGEIVVDISGYIGGCIEVYKSRGVSYFMTDDLANILGLSALSHDARTQRYAELEEEGYKVPMGDKIVLKSHDEVMDYALYQYMNKPIAKGEMISALASIIMVNELNDANEKAIVELGMTKPDAKVYAVEELKSKLFYVRAAEVNKKEISNAAIVQDKLNKFLSDSVKKLPRVRIHGNDAIMVRKFMYKGVQYVLMYKLTNPTMNSGLLSNYASISAPIGSDFAKILLPILKQELPTYVQKPEFVTEEV